jgi:tripartite ATP-independent transporter DctP family solute receptor
MRLLTLCSGLALSALLSSAELAHAQDVEERRLKLAFLPTAQHPIGLGAKKFAEIVGEQSGGKMDLRLFPGGVLGGDLQVVSALQGGTVEMTILVTSLLAANVTDYLLLDAPFLFDNEQEADAILDGPVGQALLAKLPEKGLVGLGYFEFGFRHFTNSRRPIEKLEDLQGLKIRVSQTPLFIDFVNALGASATPLAIPELYTALEQKAVDGTDAPLSFIRLQKYDEVQKYLVLTKHLYNPQVILVSKKIWDQLTNDEQMILQQAAQEARAYQRQTSREQDAIELEALKQSMEVTEMPPEELEKMRDKARPVVEKYNKDIDQSLVNSLQAELDELRGSN